jgi:hypothetical protein
MAVEMAAFLSIFRTQESKYASSSWRSVKSFGSPMRSSMVISMISASLLLSFFSIMAIYSTAKKNASARHHHARKWSCATYSPATLYPAAGF